MPDRRGSQPASAAASASADSPPAPDGAPADGQAVDAPGVEGPPADAPAAEPAPLTARSAGRGSSGPEPERGRPVQRRRRPSRRKANGRGAGTRKRSANQLPAGRHGLSRDEVSGSQRRRLLDAMAELCAEKGYPEVRIAEVVERAGVSRATFYELFKDKEDCFVETMEEAFKHLTDRVMPAVYRQEGPWHERVAGVVEALLDYFASDPAYSKAALVEALAGGERAYERYMAGVTLIMSLIDQGRSDVTHDVPLPSKTARAVLGGCESLIVAEMMAGRTERIPDLLPDFIYLVLTPYLGQAEAIRLMEEAAARRGR